MIEAAAPMWQTWAVFAGVLVVIGFYISERASMEMISAGTVAAILLFFFLFPLPESAPTFGPPEILAGFANPALITIMALLVVGRGMFQTGAVEWLARRLGTSLAQRPHAVFAIVLLVAFAISAFMNNTPVVVMFIPLAAALAERMNRPASKVMMPLSFVCILAGMTTLIGSSTNLLVGQALTQAGGGELEFFEPARMGIILAGAGMIYLWLIAPRLLPAHSDPASAGNASGRQFIAQIEVTNSHPLVGKKPVAGMFADLPDITVRLIQRGEKALLPPFEDVTLRAGDVMIVAATRTTLTELLSSRADFLHGVLSAENAAHLTDDTQTGGFALIEAVVAPGARVIGRTIEQAGLRAATGAIVLGVQRRSRMFRARMSDIRLEAGDVLLLFASDRAPQALRDQRDLLPLQWSATQVPDIRRAGRARGVFAAVVIAAATGALPILHASMLGALAMVLLKCVNLRQAARAFDLRIYLLIGAAFALGGALQATHGADLIATAVVAGASPYGVTALLSALFLVVAILTNVLSNSATAVLFAPIAIAAADKVDADPAMFALTVLFAANCSFATPVAYQTNLLVMGPGRYGFADFVKVGAPLVVIVWLAFTLSAPWAFGL